MSFLEVLDERFGGLKNGIMLLIILIVCLRFAGAEWNTSPLEIRLLYSFYLILGVISAGLIVGFTRVALIKINKIDHSTSQNFISENFVRGLKIGIVVGGIIIFMIGVMFVKDYLKPILDLYNAIADWFKK